jgi:hypothetical protein
LTRTHVRAAALELPGTEEKSHFGKADFRVGNRIFATLPEKRRAVIKLTPDQQSILTAAEPAIFAALAGGWGRKGWTSIRLDACDLLPLKSALTTAWRNAAPQALRKDGSR